MNAAERTPPPERPSGPSAPARRAREAPPEGFAAVLDSHKARTASTEGRTKGGPDAEALAPPARPQVRPVNAPGQQGDPPAGRPAGAEPVPAELTDAGEETIHAERAPAQATAVPGEQPATPTPEAAPATSTTTVKPSEPAPKAPAEPAQPAGPGTAPPGAKTTAAAETAALTTAGLVAAAGSTTQPPATAGAVDVAAPVAAGGAAANGSQAPAEATKPGPEAPDAEAKGQPATPRAPADTTVAARLHEAFGAPLAAGATPTVPVQGQPATQAQPFASAQLSTQSRAAASAEPPTSAQLTMPAAAGGPGSAAQTAAPAEPATPGQPAAPSQSGGQGQPAAAAQAGGQPQAGGQGQPGTTGQDQQAVPAGQAQAPQGAQAPAAPVAATPLAQPIRSDVAPAVRLDRAAESVEAVLHLANARGITHARIELHPVELGGVEIRLRSTAQGIVANVTADSIRAVETLQQAGSELRRTLEAQGIELLSLDIGMADDGERPERSDLDGEGRPRRGDGSKDSPEAEASEDTGAETQVQLPNGVLVDVLA